MRRLLALALVSVVLSCSGGEGPLEFTVTFEDAQGLQPGQFVVYNGIRVGEVREVDLDASGRVVVLVRAYDKYRDALYREAEFVIEKPGGMIDVSGERQITVNDRSRPRTPIENGDVIEGTDGWVDSALGRLGDLVQGAGEYGRAVWDKARAYATSPQAQELYRSLEDAAARAREVGVEGYRTFMEETYPELEAKALAFKNWLVEQGRLEEAKQFWNDFVEWSKRLLGSTEEPAQGDEEEEEQPPEPGS